MQTASDAAARRVIVRKGILAATVAECVALRFYYQGVRTR